MAKKKEASTLDQEHQKALDSMATEDFTNDILALLRSRAPLVYLTCVEEQRLKVYFRHLAAVRGYKVFIWDCYNGLLDLITEKEAVGVSEDLTDPLVALEHIISSAKQDEANIKNFRDEGISGNIYILLDFHRYLDDAPPDLERRLKAFADIESMTHVVMTGPFFVTTPATEDIVSVLDFPYPNENEIKNALWSLVNAIQSQNKLPNLPKETKKNEDEIVKAANGLTLVDAQMAFSKSIVVHNKFDINCILKEKQQTIRKKGILEFL